MSGVIDGGIIRSVEVHPLRLRLREPFAVTSGARDHIDTVLVRVTTIGGSVGWGEASPDTAVTGETVGASIDALRGPIAKAVIGCAVDDLESVAASVALVAPSCPAARAAIDIALHDLAARHSGAPLWRWLAASSGVAERSRSSQPVLRISRVVAMADPAEMAAVARRHVDAGFSTVKVKVGEPLHWERDVERVAAVRAAVGDGVGIKVDVNEGWRVSEVATAALEAMRQSRPLYVEQPVDRRDLDGLAEVRRRVPGIPIMADESVRGVDDVCRLVDLGAADLVNLKLMRIGGLADAVRAHAIATDAGLGVQIGTMIESSVASAAGLHLAAASAGVDLVEMGGPLMLAEDVADVAGWYHGELVTVPDRPGLGITPHLL